MRPRHGSLATVLAVLILFLSACSADPNEKILKALLLSEEFEAMPGIYRDDLYNEVYLIEDYTEISPPARYDEERQLADLGEEFNPATCWMIDHDRPDKWQAMGAAPKRSASVVARIDNEAIIERVYQYEVAGAPSDYIRYYEDGLSSCGKYTVTSSEGTFPKSITVKTAELGLPDTIAYSTQGGSWYVLSASEEFLMSLYVEGHAEVDHLALITSAVNKLRTGTGP